jgi:hypothetical protein
MQLFAQLPQWLCYFRADCCNSLPLETAPCEDPMLKISRAALLAAMLAMSAPALLPAPAVAQDAPAVTT